MASNTTVLLRKSGVSGNTPVDLVYGEIALNYADGKLYYKNGVGVKYITNQKTFSTINVNSSLILASSYTDTLNFNSANGITLKTDAVHNLITIDGGNILNLTSSAYNKANAALTLAQAAYNQANVASGGGSYLIADTVSAITDNTIVYLPVIDQQTGQVSSLYTDANNLSYDITTGVLNTNGLTITPNVEVSTTFSDLSGVDTTIFDSFSALTYRSGFYQVSLEYGLDFHSLYLTVLNSDSSAKVVTHGDAYTLAPLGTFSANVSSDIVNVLFTPYNPTTSVLFSRKLLKRRNTTDIPPSDSGTIGTPPDFTLDLGYVAETATQFITLSPLD